MVLWWLLVSRDLPLTDDPKEAEFLIPRHVCLHLLFVKVFLVFEGMKLF